MLMTEISGDGSFSRPHAVGSLPGLVLRIQPITAQTQAFVLGVWWEITTRPGAQLEYVPVLREKARN